MSTDSVVEPPASPQSPLGVGDYGHALVHIAWYRADQARSLMFGFVELYPVEFSAPQETPEKSFKLRRLGSRNYLHLKRTRMAADTAIDWYVRCIQGDIRLPNDLDHNGVPKVLASAGFAQEPPWPQLITISDQFPFVPQCWQTPRIHHLLQPELNPDARAAANDPQGRKWLSEQVFVDFDSYAELLGSLHLIAPNPALRGIDHRQWKHTGGEECSILRFRPRANHPLHGTRVILADHRPTGLGGVIEAQITSTSMRIPHPAGGMDQIETIVLDPAGAILSYSKPHGFIQAVNVEITMSGAQQAIVVPAAGAQPQSSYTRHLRGDEFTTAVGTPRFPKEAVLLFFAGESRREMQRLDEQYPERWFHGDRQAATAFVRELISAAKKRLWIVDPYFTAVELIRYALATSNTSLPVLILTSAEAMTEKDRINPSRKAADMLQDQLPHLARHGNFTIRVLTGSPAVHDRFLVIDDSVWFSGNSLHTIGERAGMLVKLRNSAEIITNLSDILNSDRTASWEEWIANRIPDKHPRMTAGTGIFLATAAGIATIGFWTAFRRIVRGWGR